MKVYSTAISGLSIVGTDVFHDPRGAFMRLFCEQELAELLDNRRIVQANHSRTSQIGAIRGMHFQHSPHAEMKMVRCLRGRVWDVVVDLRNGSPTFLQGHSQELTPENALMLIIPEGCAHGFQVMEADSELLYLHTAPYTSEAEGGVRFDDPAINITWPLSVSDLSTRDQQHPLINNNFKGLNI